MQTASILTADLFHSQVQRNFAYSTQDVREAYACVKEALLDTRIKKVVFILHSQGGIEGGLILDWLFAEVSRTALQHLEVGLPRSFSYRSITDSAPGLYLRKCSESLQQP